MTIPKSHGGVIGKARRRVDGRAKVTGQTRFADDLLLPRMVHCRLLRSTVPHGRIRVLDVTRARALAACISSSPATTSRSPTASCR